MRTAFDNFFFRAFSIFCLFTWTAAQKSNTKFVGCFLGENALSIVDERRTFSPMSPQSCSAFCAGKRYAFFNLRKDTCHCSKNYLAREMVQYIEDDCKIKCTGDYSASCVESSNFVSSYLTDSSNFKIDDRFIGCFTRPEMPSSNMEFELLYTNSPDVCSAICTNEAYSFAGTEGLKCVCSNSVPRSHRKLHSSECDRNCVGDPNKTCGGEDRIQIYDLRRSYVKTKVISAPIYPPITEPPRQKIAITTATESNFFTEKYSFLNINKYWKHEIYIPHEPDNEFVYYDKSDNIAFIENKELVIKPTIISDTEFIKKGSLHLNGCTRNDDCGVCARTALSYDILPPIVSAKLTTENSELFKYGRVEVVAKLPIGDWIVTEMALISKHNEKSKLVLLAKGNADLKCKGRDESVNAINAAYTLIDDRHFANSSTYIYSSKKWTDDYHSFEFSRTPNSVVVKVDGKIHNMDRPNFVGFDSIFRSQLYLSISVSAGGMRDFNDDCLSKGRTKPWRNYHLKAMLNFYNDMNNWSSTWTEDRSKLRIRSVKFSKLDQNYN